ncbi:UDP-4-amino-4,6-dideoxy-N-acetyl-beta-L-altrosamine transaminase, partial [Prochlorococcus sp. AH-716-F13]|nr:UDP-4-amino-4,6-dideoxy-N-acetyl-beta-L-altrosamine transaminase [Prochlorococcus sp. AH-716-F13]
MDDLIPYGKQNITPEDIEAVLKVLKSDLITQGPNINIFEKAINDKLDCKFSVAVNSATSALHISCLALELSSNDTLWTVSNSFVASANCGRYCGAQIDFVDINPKTGLMCIDHLKKKLEEAKKLNCLPKIVIPVHLTGTCCDMAIISELSKIYNFKIIEDASHAIGGKYKCEYIGNCKYSSITIFSFHPVKIITTGEGGLATTNNPKIYERLKALRTHGIVKEKEKFLFDPPGPWHYEQQYLGLNYRMTDIHAALGISQLKRLDEICIKRNSLLERYKEKISTEKINFLEIPSDCFSSVHLCVIKLKKLDKNIHRKFFDFFRNNKIGVQLHYAPIHLQPYYQNLGF